MLGILIEKELKSILLSPKFSATFAVCSILIMLSIYTGIVEYRQLSAEYETAVALEEQNRRDSTSYSNLFGTVYRQPDPMQVFVSGVNNDIGTQARLTSGGIVNLTSSNYSDNTVFAVFRFLDLTFIIQIGLSLFAILFTYDALSGERESGTLKLNMANAVPRSRYIVAKFIGSWLGLVLPLLIPLLLGVLLVLLYQVPMTATHWIQFGLFLLVSVLYFTFFITLGLLVSSLTRHSSTAFLFLLVVWIALVFIVPRAGVTAAGQIVPVPTSGEISAQINQYRTQLRNESEIFRNELRDELLSENVSGGLDEYNRRNEERADRDNQLMAEFNRSLQEDLRNRQLVRQGLGFSLSRISPASSYQLAVMELAGTDTGLKTRTEDLIRDHNEDFYAYREQKIEEENAFFEQNPQARQAAQSEPLDLSGMPEFRMPERNIGEAVESILPDIGLLGVYTMLALAGAFFAFLRYDVR